jgi:hypothetical protein
VNRDILWPKSSCKANPRIKWSKIQPLKKEKAGWEVVVGRYRGQNYLVAVCGNRAGLESMSIFAGIPAKMAKFQIKLSRVP